MVRWVFSVHPVPQVGSVQVVQFVQIVQIERGEIPVLYAEDRFLYSRSGVFVKTSRPV